MNTTIKTINETEIANLAGILKDIAAAEPTRLALIQGSGESIRSISYGELSNQVALKATKFLQTGLRKNDIVLMLQPMSIELYVSILAIFRIGATVLIADASAGLKAIDRAVKFVKPDAVIAAGKGIFAALALKSVRQIDLRFVEGFKLPGWHSVYSMNTSSLNRDVRFTLPVTPIAPVAPDHPALITFTSGTSGTPKAIVRSHEFLRAQLSALQNNTGLQSNSRELTSLPIFVLANLASSVTTILPDADLSKMSKIKVEGMIDQMTTCKPGRILGSPALVEAIISFCRKHELKFESVKSILTGGGPVFPRMIQDAREVFPNAEILVVYGSTEAEPIAKTNFSKLSQLDIDAIKDGAGLPVGVPVPEIQIRISPIVERDGQLEDSDQLATLRHICERAEVPLDRIGEILVTGDHVVKGYLHGIGNDETKIEIDGQIWHRTGDVGYLDEGGRIWLTGRVNASSKDATNAKSALDIDTLFSQCIEAAVLSHDIIRRAACVRSNHKTTIYVEPTKRQERVDTSILKDGLGWSQMDAIKVVRHIPLDKRHNTKVLYNKLA